MISMMSFHVNCVVSVLSCENCVVNVLSCDVNCMISMLSYCVHCVMSFNVFVSCDCVVNVV